MIEVNLYFSCDYFLSICILGIFYYIFVSILTRSKIKPASLAGFIDDIFSCYDKCCDHCSSYDGHLFGLSYDDDFAYLSSFAYVECVAQGLKSDS